MEEIPQNVSPFARREPPKALEYQPSEKETPAPVEISRPAKILFLAMLVIIFALGIALPVLAVLMLVR